MKAARIHRFGPPDVIVVEDIPRPSPAPREVLVRVAAAGVGPWDALIREGKSNVSPPPPLTLGSDLSGVVEAVGSGVSQFKNGDEIYGVTNPQFVGAQAAFALAAADMVSPKPARLSSLEAASVPVVAVTAWQMLFEHARPEAGHRVIDTVGGDTRDRAFGVLKPGGILVTVVSTAFVPRVLMSARRFSMPKLRRHGSGRFPGCLTGQGNPTSRVRPAARRCALGACNARRCAAPSRQNHAGAGDVIDSIRAYC